MPDIYEPETVAELVDRLPPTERRKPIDVGQQHGPLVEDICLSLIRVRQRLDRHTSEDLLSLKHTAEATAYLIRRELAGRDAALIDLLCKQED